MSSTEADRIMDTYCFSTEIAQFLLDEKNYLTQVFLQENYDCIIEVGCSRGHNAHWLSKLCRRYVGVDINKDAISDAKTTYIGAEGIEFHCTPVENLISVLKPDEDRLRRRVVLFPFNLFGNFVNITGLLSALENSSLDVDLAMSNFNTKSCTTIGRYKYYVNCFGDSPIRVYDAEQGVLFKAGQSFQSIAYNPEYLTKVIHGISSYHGIIVPFSVYGDLFLLSK